MWNKIVKWYNRHLITPWWVYVITLIVAIILLNTPCVLPIALKWEHLLENVGYGVISSLVFAILVDVGNCAREGARNKTAVSIMTAELRKEFLKLRESVQTVAEEKYGSDSKKRAFSEWVDLALQQDDSIEEDIYWGYVHDVIYHIKKIQVFSTGLLDKTIVLMDKFENVESFRETTKSIDIIATIIVREFENEKFEKIAYYIKEKLANRFLRLYPEYGDLFNNPYNYFIECDEE